MYLLDKGDYKRGEEELKRAIQSVTDPYEIAGIKACYAELLYEEKRYKEAMVYIEEVLNVEDEYLFSEEKDIVMEIRQKIMEEQA